MNKKIFFFLLLLLLVSFSVFASYTHITFSLSSVVGVGEDVRYRFLGSTDWVYVKDKGKVSMCIDPSKENRIVLEAAGEDMEWKDLCTASIMALPSSYDGASAKWSWKDLGDSVTGARWKITGGKWNYIPVSENSVYLDNLKMGKLSVFTLQSTVDGDTWRNENVHGVIPVSYNEKKLTNNKCDICNDSDTSLSHEIKVVLEENDNVKAPMEEKKEVAVTDDSSQGKESTKTSAAPGKTSSASFVIYGGYTNSERTLFYTDDSPSIESGRSGGGEGGMIIMFNNKFGLDLSYSFERHLYGEREAEENTFGMGFVFVENNESFFSPYVKWLFQESFFKIGSKEGKYATAKAELGASFYFTPYFGLYGGVDTSFTFVTERELRPEVLYDAINTRYGFVLGGLIRFGKGGTK